MKKKIILLISSILLLISCNKKIDILKSKETKKGGIFEMTESGKEYQFYNSENTVKLNTETYISFQEFENLYLGKNSIDMDRFQIMLNDSGKMKLARISNRNVDKQLYFVVNNKIISAPFLNSPIKSGIFQMVLNKKETNFIKDYFSN